MNVAFIQMGRIGDMVLMTPLFSEFKKLFPYSKITVFAGPSNYSILLNNPHINQIVTIEKSPLGIIKTLFSLRFNKYDYWIDPKDHFSKESRIIAKIVNAKHKIGFNLLNKTKVFDLDLPIPQENLHHTQIALNSITALGYEPNKVIPKPILFTSEDSNLFVEQFVSNFDNGFVILNISGSSEHKMWDNSNWIEFLNNVKITKPIVLCFAPNEKLRAEKLIQSNPTLIPFYSRNINDVISLTAKCTYLISPDTAIIHIAAAFNKPVFALYSGLEHFYSKFHPLSDSFISVRAAKGDKGIKSITAKFAIQEFEKFIDMTNSIIK